MRIESVTAVAFGPFKGVTLDFSPQLTVVYGPNEAGKSTWHAAIYASLCGMRRGRGQFAQDRDFAKLRRPWSGDAWEVRAIVRLDSGRRVELRQDLSDLARCSAVDADFGRDVATEILNEGTPDAARWLGLDRHSFLAVACVRQAEIQSVVENADSLQGELQRAAASAARDSTAAEAIARLEDFQREQVGQDRVNSTKPLQRARVGVKKAEDALTFAQKKHADWLTLEADARDKRRKAEEQSRKLRMLRAQWAREVAESWRDKLERARALTQAYPQGPPAPLFDDEALAQEVAAALESWQNRLELPALPGKSSAAIRAEIKALPSMPSGDLVPRAEPVAAMKAYERAVQALEFHQTDRPSAIPIPDAKGLTANQLRDLARALEAAVPSVDSGLETAHREAQHRLDQFRSSQLQRWLLGGFAVAGVLGGVAFWTLWNHWIGAALVAAGTIALVWLVVRSGENNREQALRAFLKIEAQLLAQRNAVEDARSRINAVRAQLVDAGLSVNPLELRDLADGLLLADRHRQLQEDWLRTHEKLQSELAEASEELARGLRDAGAADAADLTAAFQAYEQACQSRAQQAHRAAARDALHQQILDREAAERAVADAQAQRSNAERKIMAALAASGLDAPAPDAASDVLRRWQVERKERLVKFDQAAREYSDLMALLDGGTLEDLETHTSEHQRRAAELAAEFGLLPEAIAAAPEQELQEADAAARSSEIEAGNAETLARDRAQSIPSVSEAEEALAAAQQELERVTRLNQTLDLTLNFLRTAEERVHRDIAPLLAAGLRQWLPSVTQHRYTDARVDPRDLCVQVLGPDNEWHETRQVSHGTDEQIYLLLRVVLAERLATTGETCPLILDDVLVQSDLGRKHALLDVVVSISRERQVILFTQEEEVLRWAQANVVAPDRVVVLPGPA